MSEARTHIDFLAKAKYAFLFSGILIIWAIYLWSASGSGKYGIDFKGGFEFVVKVPTGVTSEQVRAALEKNKFEDVAVQSFELGSSEYSIRLPGEEANETAAKSAAVTEALKEVGGAEIIKTDYVGPTVGIELRNKAFLSLGLGLLGMLIYIAIRFEFAYALGAVAALFHDVIICCGFYLLAGHTLNMGTLAAALTIVGYSVNDTIVIFDRVREEMAKSKASLAQVMNESMNLMLSRTIITSLLTFFSALSLYLVGGGAISDLSWFLVVGILSGCYSTIYIAAPVVLAWDNYRNRKA